MLSRIAVGTSDQGHHRRSGPSNEPKIAIAIAPGTTLPMLNSGDERTEVMREHPARDVGDRDDGSRDREARDHARDERWLRAHGAWSADRNGHGDDGRGHQRQRRHAGRDRPVGPQMRVPPMVGEQDAGEAHRRSREEGQERRPSPAGRREDPARQDEARGDQQHRRHDGRVGGPRSRIAEGISRLEGEPRLRAAAHRGLGTADTEAGSRLASTRRRPPRARTPTRPSAVPSEEGTCPRARRRRPRSLPCRSVDRQDARVEQEATAPGRRFDPSSTAV